MLIHSVAVSSLVCFSQDAMNGRVVMVAPDVGLREFTFDGVLSGENDCACVWALCYPNPPHLTSPIL